MQEEKFITIDQHTQHVEAHLECVEDGIHAILNMLQVHPHVNNQPAAAPVIGEEVKVEEEEKEEGKLLHYFL